MSIPNLPKRASLEYLKKLSKERLRDLRLTDSAARLSDAHVAIAREHGFPSWRALKAEVDRRRAPALEAYFAACAAGDVEALRGELDRESGLVRERDGDGSTGLHGAVRHPDAVQFLIDRGADPDARNVSDHALPLHVAAGHGHLQSVRALLDRGSDVHGFGDLHGMDVIGWACCFAEARRDVVELLVSHGARHHVFSAIALGDLDILQSVVEQDPNALRRRLSSFEQKQTALHYVIAPADGLVGGLFRTGDHYRTLELLIELAADLEALDAKGRSPLAVAMLRGDQAAMQLLHRAGAAEPETLEEAPSATPSDLASSVSRLTPMLGVPDMAATVAWYRSIGFELTGSYGEEGTMNWACVELGDAQIMLVQSGDAGPTSPLSLWLYTDRIDDLYAQLKQRRLERACVELAAKDSGVADLSFTTDLYTAFYGQREFGIRDPNGVELMFAQPV